MKKILLVIVVLVVIGAVGSALGLGDDTGDDKDGEAASPTLASTKGKQPMTWGNWQLVGKITVDEDFYGSFEPSFNVKNIGDEPDSGTFDVTYLKGTQVLGTSTCYTASSLAAEDVVPGEVSGVYRCDSEGDFETGWTEITIEDSF